MRAAPAQPASDWPTWLFDYRGLDAATVTSMADAALEAAEAEVTLAVDAAMHEGTTLDTVIGRMDRALASLWDAHGPTDFQVLVHPDEEVRVAAQATEQRMNTWRRSLPFRDDVADAVTRYAGSADAGGLAGEDLRLLDRWQRDVRRSGYGLPDETRAELRSGTARLVELESAFQRNVNEWSDGIDVTRDDLVGMPEEFVAGLQPGTAPGTLRVSLDYPEIYPFLNGSPRRDLRERLLRKMYSRVVEANRPLLEELVTIRRHQARLLGYASWAHYRLEPRMARTPERVAAFHGDLFPAFRRRATGELADMADRLETDTADRALQEWDVRYYDQRIRDEVCGVEASEVSAYLPLDGVFDGLLDLTARVFGLRYAELEEARAWHPDVRLFAVDDAASGSRLGWFYADLHPRPGKFSHAAADCLRIPLRPRGGHRVPGVAAIVANMPRPTAAGPARLAHDDVATLFHEFGHVLHEILGRSAHYGTAMPQVEEDFIEAVSQTMENWAWEPSTLERIGRHVETGEPMPAALARRLAASRHVNLGVHYLRWFGMYGEFDMLVHGPDAIDLDDALRRADALRGLPFVEGTFWPAAFGHIVGGYDAGYYGYLWSMVYGDDLWSRFASEGIDDPAVGADYRREILECGSARDAQDQVEAFLGRPSTSEAFLRRTGFTT